MRKKEFEAFAKENGIDVEKGIKEVEYEIALYNTNWNVVTVSIDETSPYTVPVGIFTPGGYRKKTTGEYVSRAYLLKFGYKNTYYQKAKLEIGFPKKPIVPNVYKTA